MVAGNGSCLLRWWLLPTSSCNEDFNFAFQFIQVAMKHKVLATNDSKHMVVVFFSSPFSGVFQPVFLLKISLSDQNHPFLTSIISQVNLQHSKQFFKLHFIGNKSIDPITKSFRG